METEDKILEVKFNINHKSLLEKIVADSGQATQHTFSDNYLGSKHPRYAISASKLRAIAKGWAFENKHLTASEFCDVIDALVHARSFTEKIVAGMIMDYASNNQTAFDPKIFDQWLEELEGWAEVDSLCTGKYTIKVVPRDWLKWEKIINRFAKSKNIYKRRASLVLLCSPIRYWDDTRMRDVAFKTIAKLAGEKDVLISRAISWLLRSMVKLHKQDVTNFLEENKTTLPAIAVRETLIVLKTGKKTGKKVDS